MLRLGFCVCVGFSTCLYVQPRFGVKIVRTSIHFFSSSSADGRQETALTGNFSPNRHALDGDTVQAAHRAGEAGHLWPSSRTRVYRYFCHGIAPPPPPPPTAASRRPQREKRQRQQQRRPRHRHPDIEHSNSNSNSNIQHKQPSISRHPPDTVDPFRNQRVGMPSCPE